MDQLISKVTIFLAIFLSSESIVSAELYFDSNNYDDFSSHVLNTRQYNARFGHQNPILAAPTLAPEINSEPESEESSSGQFYKQSWKSVFTQLPLTSTQRTPSSPHPCPIGFGRSWTGACIQQQTTPFPSFDGNYRTVTKYLCPVGQIATRPHGQCFPTTPEPEIWHRATLLNSERTTTTPKTSLPRRPQHRKMDVQYGHQNPILVAPTLNPRSTPVPEFFSTTNFPTSTRKTSLAWEDWTSTMPSIGLSPCDQGSAHHRLDPRTNRCFALGSIEPCGEYSKNLAFYARESDQVYGECDCILGSSRPLVYHKETDTCYFVYQQAYCEEKQWLTLNDQGVPNCKHNPCYAYGEMVLNWDWKRNSNATYMNTDGIVPVYEVEKCVPLGQICHRLPNGTLVFAEPMNPSETFSQFSTVLIFLPGSLEPDCHQKRTEIGPPTNNIQSTTCRPGSKSNILGRCKVTITKKSRDSFISESQTGALVNELPNFNFATQRNKVTNWILVTLLSLCNFLQ